MWGKTFIGPKTSYYEKKKNDVRYIIIKREQAARKELCVRV